LLILYYGGESKKVERVEVKGESDKYSFSGTAAEYIEWVEKIYQGDA